MKKESCLIIAGEKSGEEHALDFFDDLQKRFPQTHFFGVGGDQLAEKGVELIYHLKEFSSFGFSEVIGKIPFYLRAKKRLVNECKLRNTKMAILIDFQGLNLRLAELLHKEGVKIFYYVAPQAWVWKEYRVKKIRQYVDHLFCILPFEKKWFQERGVRHLTSVAHPVYRRYLKLESVTPRREFNPRWGEEASSPCRILVLPGSRNSEVQYVLPLMMKTLREMKKRFHLSLTLVQTTSVKSIYYKNYLEDFDFFYPSEDLVKAFAKSDIALAASGTVTLETGLYGLPTVVGYNVSQLNQFLYHQLIAYQGPFSLTNIILGKMVFPELIQERFEPYNIERAILGFMKDKNAYDHAINELARLPDLLKGEGITVGEVIATQEPKS